MWDKLWVLFTPLTPLFLVHLVYYMYIYCTLLTAKIMTMMIKIKKKWTKRLVKKDLSKSQEMKSQQNTDAEKVRDHKQ